ncbi:MAG: ABC transporter permease [Candidatus Polarisedimenticolia bacterium]
MIRFVVRRLLWTLPVLWVAATLVWIFMFLIPGDPARILAGQSASPERLEAVRATWGLDDPPPLRYVRFMGMVARGDLGTSYVQSRPVSAIVAEAMGRTFVLALVATALAAAAGLLLGLGASVRRGGPVDHAVRGFSSLAVSLPTFWVGMMLMLLFASRLGWLPVSGYGDGPVILGFRLPSVAHLVLPSLTLALFSCGYVARVARAELLEEKERGYVRAVTARGAGPLRSLGGHALSNALVPVVTLVGLNFGWLLGGAVVTETVFNWPGIGTAILRGLNNRDLPVVEGAAIVLTASFLLVNLAVDLVCGWLDPRARL